MVGDPPPFTHKLLAHSAPSSQTQYPSGVPVSYGSQDKPVPSGNPSPPAVPSIDDGKGGTSVNTDALTTVAGNIGQLSTAVQTALGTLNDMSPVAPGGLVESYTLKNKVGSPSGQSGGGSGSGGQSGSSGQSGNGLTPSYQQVLGELVQGLAEIQNALSTMASTYSTFDDLNKLTVQDLEGDLGNAEADFGAMMSDNPQGSAPTTWPGQTDSPASPGALTKTPGPGTKTPAKT
jgi:hypothetical protein